MATFFGPGAVGLPFTSSAVTKVEPDGRRYPKGDFAYTPDNVPSHWKLRLTNTPGGKPDPKIVGMAVAALGSGFRGEKVQIPRADLPQVKRRVLQAWRAANPGNKDVPSVLQNLDADAEGVAPPGWETTVKKMKKSGEIDNPWALAWWLRNRGAQPAKHENDMNASADTVLVSLIRQQHQIPPVCIAAARGESWAQAQLLADGCAPILIGERW